MAKTELDDGSHHKPCGAIPDKAPQVRNINHR